MKSPLSIMSRIQIRPEGHLFIAIFALITIVFFNVAQWLGWAGLFLVGWCIYFFRDPDRVTPDNSNLVISPADGIIQMLTEAAPPSELDMGENPMKRISIFMSVFDCHVNRSPINGTVTKDAYRPGKFVNATLDKASESNERRSLTIRTAAGAEIAVVQIAGLIARRIISWTGEGRNLDAGERYGMIRFGSRLDVYLPLKSRVLVLTGQRSIAGETPIAFLEEGNEDKKALDR